MGLTECIFGKKKKDEFEVDEDEPVWDPAYMYYDNFGVLRLGREERNRDQELRDIKELEDKTEQDDKVWYIIESSWVRQWLRYTNTNRNTPCPGPIKNEHLLQFEVISAEDLEKNFWSVRAKLEQANSIEGREGEGHYRRINKEVWDKFAELYPDSGPVITVIEKPYEDGNNWTIDLESLKKIDRLRKVEEDSIEQFRKKEKMEKTVTRSSTYILNMGQSGEDSEELDVDQDNDDGIELKENSNSVNEDKDSITSNNEIANVV